MKREQLPLSFEPPAPFEAQPASVGASGIRKKHPYAATERGLATQIRIDYERTRELARMDLQNRLGAMLGRPLALVITDNTRTMISSPSVDARSRAMPTMPRSPP